MSVKHESGHAVETLGRPLHSLPDLQVLASLTKMLYETGQEGKYDGWFVAIPFSDGRIRYISHHLRGPLDPLLLDVGVRPDEDQVDFLRTMVIELNTRIAHDGCWICCWFENCTRLVSFWKDVDGDTHAFVYMDDQFRVMREKPIDYWIEQCEEALRQTYEKFIDPLELKAGQTVKSALGEKPATH